MYIEFNIRNLGYIVSHFIERDAYFPLYQTMQLHAGVYNRPLYT